jgi:hypothetical protein
LKLTAHLFVRKFLPETGIMIVISKLQIPNKTRFLSPVSMIKMLILHVSSPRSCGRNSDKSGGPKNKIFAIIRIGKWGRKVKVFKK